MFDVRIIKYLSDSMLVYIHAFYFVPRFLLMDQDFILVLSSLLLLPAPCSLHRHTHNSGTVIFYIFQLFICKKTKNKKQKLVLSHHCHSDGLFIY